MDVENQELFGVYYEEQDGILLGNEYSPRHSVYPGQDDHSSSPEKLLEEWAVPGVSNRNESEPEDVLQTMINPNEVYNGARGTVEAASETDSGISDDQHPDSPQQSDPEPAHSSLFQLVYGVSPVDSLKTEEETGDINPISIRLGGWNTPTLIPEACVVDTALAFTGCVRSPLSVTDSETDLNNSLMHFSHQALTEEEKRLLNQEGIVLPRNLPLTKAEERILKKVRRKIRNKQSAQESRRRKKEYIDGLESRVAACTAQNLHLQKQMLQLEHHNVSLLSQLRRLQCLIKETSNKAAQTSTCIMIMAFSLVLLIFPSYNLIRLETPVNQEEYKPTGVISRTILTDLESSQISELAGSSLLDPTAPVELQEEPVPLADSLASNSRHQPIVRGNRSGLGTEAEVPGAGRPQDSLVRKTVQNPAPGLQDEPSDAGNPTPGLQPLRRRAPADSSSPGDRESSAKPGHADEM